MRSSSDALPGGGSRVVPSEANGNICSGRESDGKEPKPAMKIANFSVPAAVVKLVYTRRSGRRALTGVEVRILSAALEA